MTKPRNRRSDSAAAAVLAAQNVAMGPRDPLPHAPIISGARPFWDAIMRNRPRDRWNDADLANAAVLATCQHDVERLTREVAAEGDVVDGKLNPKHALIDKLVRRGMGLSRMLHVHPEATDGRSQNAGKALANERNTALVDDDLIPTLRVVSG